MSVIDQSRINLLSFSGKMRILHLTWFAFFLSFFVWFNHAPLLGAMRDSLGLTDQQIKTLLILNVTLTIPGRIIIGMLTDAFGPRRVYSGLLFISAFLCFGFAVADTYEQLAMMRFLLGFAGAGFVIGIRMISEWFPAKQAGVAQGIYGGWGNFGSAGAALLLPSLAVMFGGDNGWRYAIAISGVIAFVYGIFYYFSVSNTPRGSTYFKPKKMGGMEVTSKFDFFLYCFMSLPMVAALGVLAWKLSPAGLNWYGDGVADMIYAGLAAVYLYQVFRIYQINREVFVKETPDIFRYKFSQVAVLDLAYMVTFGSELALVSMLPLFYTDTFNVSVVLAGALAAVYPVMNLIARPAGGLISDRIGRKKTLVILFTGITLSFILLAQVSADWALALVVATTILCGLFAKAGSGAVFAMVPLIQRRMTGQIAGMAGAYGNVGGVVFLTVLSFVSPQSFFLFIGICAAVVLASIVLFMREPRGQMAEIQPDGTVQMIDVA